MKQEEKASKEGSGCFDLKTCDMHATVKVCQQGRRV